MMVNLFGTIIPLNSQERFGKNGSLKPGAHVFTLTNIKTAGGELLG